MSNPYVQSAASTREVMAQITPDQLENATPCQSWNVAEMINHVIGAQHFFAAPILGQPPAETQDWAAGDYMAAYDEATASCAAAFAQEGILQQMVSMPFGDMPGAAVMGLAANDTFTHGWDLAKATGQSTDLAPELAAGILANAQQSIQESFRGEDGKAPFGPEQSCADDACNADKLAAFLGRSV